MTNTNTFERALRLIKAAHVAAKTIDGKGRCDDVTLCTGYAEPGYTDPDSGVIAFCNWNTISSYNNATQKRVDVDDIPNRLCAALEKIGVEIEWSDEWAVCEGCQKAVRTQPDSHGWKRSYTDDDCLVCRDCVDPVAFLGLP